MIAAHDTADLLAFTFRLSAIGILVQSTEVLWHGRELEAGRLFGRIDRRPGWWRELLRRADDYPGCAWILGLRAALAALALVLPYGTAPAFAIATAMVTIQLYYNRRFVILAGNCETMFLVNLVSAAAGTMPGAGSWLRGVALGFVAAQVALAYFVAGVHKMGAPAWRDGTRLRQLAVDGSYAWPGFARPLAQGAGARLSSWLIIGWELLMPFSVVLPTPLFAAALVGGVIFHGLVAVTMGLHGFWWSFMAAYPGLVFLHGRIQGGPVN